MPEELSPEEVAAQRMLADPGAVRRRLAADIAAVEALGRGGAQVEPTAAPETCIAQVHAEAGRIGFRSPVEAATMSLRRLRELPAAERDAQEAIRAYHAAASRTIAQGEAVRATGSAQNGWRLSFHRAAAEAARTAVTLQAHISVDPEGSVWLESFGWPVETDAAAVYVFGATSEKYLAQAAADLRDDAVPFDRAMLMLLGAAATASSLAVSDERRREITEAAARRSGELSAYVSQAENYATAARGREWFGACLYRSAMEVLFENFLGSATFTLLDAEDLNDLDEELQETLPEAASASAAAIPAGIPDHHWWWQRALRS